MLKRLLKTHEAPLLSHCCGARGNQTLTVLKWQQFGLAATWLVLKCKAVDNQCHGIYQNILLHRADTF